MMTATADEIAETLNRAFDEPSMTMPILLADVIPALAEFDQVAASDQRRLVSGQSPRQSI